MTLRSKRHAQNLPISGNQAKFYPIKKTYNQNWACKTKTGACEKCTSADLENFSSGQLQEFLDQLVMAEALAIDLVEKMEKIYPTISESKNSEVRFRWIRVGLKVDHSSPKLEKISILGSLRKRYWQCLGNGDGTGSHEVYPALVPRFGLLGKRFLNQFNFYLHFFFSPTTCNRYIWKESPVNAQYHCRPGCQRPRSLNKKKSISLTFFIHSSKVHS